MEKIRVFVIDDSMMARNMLIRILEVEDDIEVVGEAGTGQGGIILMDEVSPDVIFLEALVGGGMKIEDVIREIKKINTDIRIILSVDPHANDVMRRALDIGISNFIRKPYNRAEILRAVRQDYRE